MRRSRLAVDILGPVDSLVAEGSAATAVVVVVVRIAFVNPRVFDEADCCCCCDAGFVIVTVFFTADVLVPGKTRLFATGAVVVAVSVGEGLGFAEHKSMRFHIVNKQR